MANLVQNVIAGKPLATGGLLSGPLLSPLPTDTTAPIDAAITGVGYISEDGVSMTIGRETDKIKAWGGDVVKITQNEHSVTLQYTMIEAARADVNREVYGEPNVTATAATSSSGNLLAVRVTAEQLPHRVRVIEIKDGDARIRLVAPDSQVTEVGDVTFQDSSIIAYPVTVECFPDDEGVKLYIYSDDGKKLAP